MKRKKPQVYYNPIDGSASLSIYWYHGPKGDAIGANNQDGVGFFGPSRELLGVIFDDVSEKRDHQELLFDQYRVVVDTKMGKVSFSLASFGSPKKGTRPSKKNPKMPHKP